MGTEAEQGLAHNVLTSPYLWGVVALLALALALSGKLDVTAARFVLFLAWALAVYAIYRSALIQGQVAVPKVLWMGLASFVFAIACYYLAGWMTPGTVALSQPSVLAIQLNRLREIQEFFEGKSEYELREIFDLNNMAKYNLKKSAIDQKPQQFTQQAIDEVEEFFKGGNFNLSLKYVHVFSMGDADHSPVLKEIPGKAYRIYCSVKYLRARQQLQRLASFTETPGPIRNTLNSFNEALDKNLDILLDLINQDLGENPDRLAHNDDDKWPYGGAATNMYNKMSVQLKPLADDVITEIRKYLAIK